MLYEQIISANGRITYKPHVPPHVSMPEIEQAEMVTLLSTLTLSMLMSIEDQLPPHKTLARKIRDVETAIQELARLNYAPLSDDLINVGTQAWNGAIRAMQEGLGHSTTHKDPLPTMPKGHEAHRAPLLLAHA